MLLAIALLGGVLALGGAAVLGKLGDHTTIIREEMAPSSPAPAAFQQGKRMSINEIYRASAPGVVHIETTSRVQQSTDFFGNPFGGSQTQRALGSGFVIDKAGHVVTNYHVVRGASTIQVSFSNNERFKAKVVGVDPSTDIAVLEVKVKSRALKALPLGNSDFVRVGDQVIAIGNPFGLDRSVTAGIVSAVQRRIEAPNQLSISHVIQTDAALNHGNSGGPLLNAQGQVIGVNAQIETGGQTQGNVGIGFAIPINTVRDVVAELIKHGKVEHPFLGIEGKTLQPNIARLFHLPVTSGVLVASVGRAAAPPRPASRRRRTRSRSRARAGRRRRRDRQGRRQGRSFHRDPRRSHRSEAAGRPHRPRGRSRLEADAPQRQAWTAAVRLERRRPDWPRTPGGLLPPEP